MASNTTHVAQSQVYLVTYSRADLNKIPDRGTFARIVLNAFEVHNVANVLHWVVCMEDHANNEGNKNPKHYHMALKLSQRMRWSRVRQYIESAHEIRVNFSNVHNTYYSAYKYVTKEDQEYLLSAGHPELKDPPATEKAIATRKEKKEKRREHVTRDIQALT